MPSQSPRRGADQSLSPEDEQQDIRRREEQPEPEVTEQLADDAEAIRAVLTEAGKQFVGCGDSLDLAFALLRRQIQEANPVKEEPRDDDAAMQDGPQVVSVPVRELFYSQASNSKVFSNGWTIERLLGDLRAGQVDLLTDRRMVLDVVQRTHRDGRVQLFSMDNQRVKCFKLFQAVGTAARCAAAGAWDATA